MAANKPKEEYVIIEGSISPYPNKPEKKKKETEKLNDEFRKYINKNQK